MNCLHSHFDWDFHLDDIILHNEEYMLNKFVLTEDEFNKYVNPKEADKFKYKNGLYYRKDYMGELDLACISLAREYALLGEVKSSRTNSNYKKACYQLLKDKCYMKQKYDIDRCFGFYITKDETKRVF